MGGRWKTGKRDIERQTDRQTNREKPRNYKKQIERQRRIAREFGDRKGIGTETPTATAIGTET